MFCMIIGETAIISSNDVNELIIVIVMCIASFVVQTGSLNIISANFCFRGLKQVEWILVPFWWYELLLSD
jgi:hypothetical protein